MEKTDAGISVIFIMSVVTRKSVSVSVKCIQNIFYANANGKKLKIHEYHFSS